jgi:hypothetical protein
MEKDSFKLVTDRMKEEGLKFTTWSALEKKLMQNPEFRRLCAEADANKKE